MADSANIAAQLPRMAALHPDELAVVVQHTRGGAIAYEEVTLKALNDASDRIASGLEAYGIGPGARTVLMVKPSRAFFALTFALFKVGAVPVMVDPGMGIANLKTCLAQAQPEAFIGITKAHVARILFGWCRGSLKRCVTVGPRLFWGGATLSQIEAKGQAPYAMAPVEAETVAAILFTSGSTGVPKGAVYTHANFNAQVEILRTDYGIQPGERDLATFPLFALFGPALGMAAVVPDMDASRPITANPKTLVAAVQDYRCTNLFASPALIERIGAYTERSGTQLPTLRRVISAGAPADPPSLARFKKALADDTKVLPSYGATEALPVALIESGELIDDTAARTEMGGGICVGRPVHSVQVRVIRITDAPIAAWSADLQEAPGVVGEIAVKGPVVTAAYFAHEAGTRLAKIPDPSDGQVWHRMGDLGYLDEQGRLWMCGRKAHRVVTEEGVLFTLPCERVFNTHREVRRTALVGVRRGGQVLPVLCVEPLAKLSPEARERLKADLLEIGSRLDHTRKIRTIVFHDGFPMDVRHNAKIFREQLADWAEGQLA